MNSKDIITSTPNTIKYYDNYLKDYINTSGFQWDSKCLDVAFRNLGNNFEKYIQKASQWCILNKNHTKLLLQNQDEYITWFNYKETVPDEHCYITFFYKNNLQNEVICTMNESINATTFTNWEGTYYKYPSIRGLKNYQTISYEELIYLLHSKSLFGRKFNKECISLINNETYMKYISNI